MAHEGKPPDGSEIAISGFPLGNPILFTTSGILASSWHYAIKETDRVVPKDLPSDIRQILRHELVDVYMGDIETYSGHSGAPVHFAENGKIIGVCVSSPLLQVVDEDNDAVIVNSDKIYYQSRITEIVPIYLVNELMIKNVIMWHVPTY